MADLSALFARRAALLRELADLEVHLGEAIAEAIRPPVFEEILGLADAARLMGEPTETFRRRPEYLKACLRRPGERRLRYSRAELERIVRDSLASVAPAARRQW